MVFKKKKSKLDLNNDGKFDSKDKSIAAKALATKFPEEGKELPVVEKKEEPKKEEKVEGRVAVKDINLQYRAGSTVPEMQIARWKECGIDYEVWF